MKKITRLITGVGLIASSLWAHPDGAEASVPNQVEEIIEWAVPAGVSRASVDRVISEAERARVIEARYIFGSGGHELTIGVPWNGTLNDDSQVIAATFSDLEGSPNAMAGDGPPEGGERSGEAVENPLPALLSAGREEVGSRGAQPAILVIEGAKDRLLASGLVPLVRPSSEAADSRTDETAQASLEAALACGNWWPFYSNSTSAASSSGGRYNSWNFQWTSSSLTALRCTGSSTFEPDFVTNNYDGRYYFSQTLLAWSTTMPSGYWDTNAFDGSQERVYTVGSSNTANVKANTTYNVYFRMSSGNYSSDAAKVVWQRGHYTWGCPSGPAWCIFADESRIQYAWAITLPGTWRP